MADYDLVIVGAGTGNAVPDESMAGWKIAIVESDRFGGTCLNRGCIPSKMFVHTADVAESVRQAQRFGVSATLNEVNWPAIRDRIFDRIDPLHDSAVRYRSDHGVTVYQDQARFVAPKVLDVSGRELRGERFLISVGSRPRIPAIPGLDTVPFHTSDTIMRIDELPQSLIILGGGYIAAEMGHIFAAFGVSVTIIERGPRLLKGHDDDISARFTQAAATRFDLRLDSEAVAVSATTRGVAVDVTTDSRHDRLQADLLLVAVGRTPNTDHLDPVAGGLDVDRHGHIVTDDSYATAVPGVWALGDCTNHFQLKHMANAEARTVRFNLTHPDHPIHTPFRVVPSAVFADPQVASVGATERQLQADSRPYLAGTSEYASAAYGWALEDTSSFAKVFADPASRLLLGAHIIGPQSSTLIQPLIQAMCLHNTVDDLARGVLYIHPALSEVVEQALLALPPANPPAIPSPTTKEK